MTMYTMRHRFSNNSHQAFWSFTIFCGTLHVLPHTIRLSPILFSVCFYVFLFLFSCEFRKKALPNNVTNWFSQRVNDDHNQTHLYSAVTQLAYNQKHNKTIPLIMEHPLQLLACHGKACSCQCHTRSVENKAVVLQNHYLCPTRCFIAQWRQWGIMQLIIIHN